ncbi:MAG: alpha/beta fold hydrolase BchO [Pseudomonadota bacterium]
MSGNRQSDAEAWPNAQLSRFVSSSPHRWHVQITGEGPDLLMIHGAAGSLYTWRDLIGPLSERYRVVTFDLPGHGLTRVGTRWRNGLEPVSGDIAHLMVTLQVQPKVIVGHSAGAAIALRLAQTLTPAPQRVVSINGALENFPGLAGIVLPMMAKTLALNPFTGPMVASTMTRLATERLIESTGSRIGADGVSLYYRLFRDWRHISGALAMMEQWSLDRLQASLEKIQQPVLCIAGQRDLAVPAATSRRAAEQMPGGELLVFPEGGHLLHEEHPEAVVREIIAFAGT